MTMNLLRPGMRAAKSVGSDMLLAAGVDGYEPGWAHIYNASDPFMPWHADGGDEGDEDEGDEDEEDKGDEDDDSDEDDDDEDKGKTPEELAAEVKRLRAAYLKKLKNSKNRGTRLATAETEKAKLASDFATLQEQFDELKKTAGKEVDSEAATRRINDLVEKAREEGKNAFKPTVIRMAARAELMAQGARPALVDRLVKMIDTGDVDIDDDDGSIDVTDQVDALKKDMPEMFGPRKAVTKRTRKPGAGGEGTGGGTGKAGARKAGGAGGGDEGAGEEKLTAAQKVANKLRGL